MDLRIQSFFWWLTIQACCWLCLCSHFPRFFHWKFLTLGSGCSFESSLYCQYKMYGYEPPLPPHTHTI
jgi:hypothetical protein